MSRSRVASMLMVLAPCGLLPMQRALGQETYTVKTELYEVDDAFHTKLKNTKPVDWEEEERRIVKGEPPQAGSLFQLLDKQTKLQTGNEVKVGDGATATLLSRHDVRTYRPTREHVLKGVNSRQSVLLGVAFTGTVHISPDRRSLRIRLTETATDVDCVKRDKVIVSNRGKETEVEFPMLKETTHTRDIEIPDGGSLLVEVHYRPKAVADKNRWWVLSITPRIVIPEEEEQIMISALDEMLRPLARVASISLYPDFATHTMSVVAGRAWRNALAAAKCK